MYRIGYRTLIRALELRNAEGKLAKQYNSRGGRYDRTIKMQ